MRHGFSILILGLLLLAGGCKEKPSLYEAVEQGNIELVKKLIEQGADVNEKNGLNETPLYRAIYCNHKEIAQILIHNGADINFKNIYDKTPIKIAAQRKHKEIVKLLIQAGAEATIRQAVYAGDVEKVKILIKNGADVNEKQKFRLTLLEIASREGDKEMVTLLIANGAKMEPPSEPLLEAVENCHEEVAEILIANGANIHSKDIFGTPLHVAAARGYVNIVELLLSNGADINIKDFYDEFTSIHLAAENGHEDIVDLLLEKGAVLSPKAEDACLIYYAAQYGLENLAEQLIHAGIDVNLKNKNLDTPLHAAARNNNIEIAKFLLVNGAEVCPKNMNGNTPLHEAAGADVIEMAKLLISYGAEINAKNWGGTTPLHYAASGNCRNMILLLIANGADVNVTDNDGDTPLHSAALKGFIEAAEILLANGSDINAEDENGNIPLDEAIRRGHEQMCELLKKHVVYSNTEDGKKAKSATDNTIEKNLESLQVQQSPKLNTAISSQSGNILALDNSKFAFNLYKQIRTGEGNMFFSPYSISTALALVYAGARSETEKQMAQTLCFSLEKNNLHKEFANLQYRLNQIQQAGDIKLLIANSFWPQKDYRFINDFLSLAKGYYDVSITPLDYKWDRETAAKTINKWVENKTENKITDLIQPRDLSALTRFVLANAIYFKGNWEHQFDPDETEDEPFYILPNKSIQTPMMRQEEIVKYAQLKSLQIVQIPYRGDDISMLILLPNDKDGLEQLEQSLSVVNLEFWRQRLVEKKVKIYLPKFTMTCTYDLNKALEEMGMVDAFKYPGADFSGMDGTHEIYIETIKHKAFVKVNEEGTEAAAATAVGGIGGGPPPSPPVFRADHPFIFMIQENKTGSILFIGRLTDPTKDI